MDFGIASVAAITVIAYLIGELVKASGLDNKWIPIICGAAGGVLGVVAMLSGVPDYPAGDYITAVAVGIVSGLAATGVNQAAKQLKSE
ncbi:MAG: phage holin family protein [Oscillospiraceae bacterium]